ncbi:NUDIX domain-containing protein [Rossellomorea vietnamensis]|uniref:NUDIX domain-containing protein n=1 Tax=Rossellomorea vietnamensis TaxID=218284 RepID=A0A5D4NM93_9BACI|nr:NUDIX domain-containing protein [Rossellomorea vietnamensis]TYS14496.1 NUDIX domain-containing protein [Rossellomorea vietnamensis]
MEKETLTIFNNEGVPIGTAPRDEVHQKGYWHETFHCWFIERKEGSCYLYFQLRSLKKKDYPNLLDITAAGHILSHETFEEGIREVREETGIEVSFADLVPVGIIPYEVTTENFIDRERARLFLYEFTGSMEDFSLEEEEVCGIFRAEFDQFEKLIDGGIENIHLKGFQITFDGKREKKVLIAKKKDFVPHENSYYQAVLENIRKYIER